MRAHLTAIALLAGFLSSPALAQSSLPPGLLSSCEGCHGAAGQTRTPETPRLNGQVRSYLISRLKDLRYPANQTISAIHAMLDPSRSMNEIALEALADHFAAQTPTQAGQNGPGRAQGEKLYAQGRGTEVPGCASCHGSRGEGTENAPRLAGQRGNYLQDQMEALMFGARTQPGMNKHAAALQPEDIRTLTAFLARD